MAVFKTIYGSTYGNARNGARDICDELTALGHQATCLHQADIKDVTDPLIDCLVVVCSTIGMGEIPSNLMPLYTNLRDVLPLCPEQRYALVALGDSSYDTFIEGPLQMEALLQEMQMVPALDMLVLDAIEVSDPETEIMAWVQQLATVFSSR